MDQFTQFHLDSLGVGFLFLLPLIIIALVVWSLIWKGLALWHSARRQESGWFIVFLLINTAGILELIYLFGVAKIPKGELFGKKSST